MNMDKAELDRQARQAAQNYQGEFAWLTVCFGLTVFTCYLATPFLVINGTIPLLAGALLMALLTYAAYTVMHDAAHGSISGSHSGLRWVNDWMGYGAAFVLMIPLTAHRHEHLTHHRHTNDPEGDPDFVVADMARSPFHAARAALRVYLAQFTFYMKQRWPNAPGGQNARFCAEIGLAVAARLVFMAQGYWVEGLVLVAVGGIGGIALLMYLFAYIVHRPHEAVGRYVDTSTIIAPTWCRGLVTWLWLFQNYHAIHHLFPRVPFYHYRALFEDIRPAMEAHGAPIYELTGHGLRAPVAATNT
jgi:beta-carotene hydroxylase